MESIKNKIAIVGVGYTPQNREPGRSALSYHLEAAKNAIEDAGLRVEDIDGILCQPTGEEPPVMPWTIAQALGVNLRFCDRQEEYGATAGCMVFHAGAALIYGLADYVVCSYGECAITTGAGAGRWGQRGGEPAVFGMFGPTTGYALAARRGIHQFGTGPETWAEIAVAQRQWANLNPRAVMHDKPMTLDDYFNCRYVIEPLRLFDICQVTNSGRAFVLTTAERARNLRHRPVYVLGVGQDHPSTNIIQSDFMTGPTGAKKAGEDAFKMAGVNRKDIDACEIYDCYTYTVEVTMMDYGFFGPGEGKNFFASGRTVPGGELPVNTSGGLLSEVYQQGFTPLTEAVVQLQGRAGQRQLGPRTKTKEPEIILVSGNGGVLQTHATVILSNEPG